ncbi:MAG: hypothetical protein COU11_04735 [Candidatus Harrisonbacteria bacterium CG10_big_fil_rev_8_21_14_0_10_49_15]|uniref:Uncharacterized protein n=1 Tax=Candidatus Harrisonbacteria bacterium CG10_big_fil_rev_8_21_14_0_10_49_15 TaxID=1974587 RepID=A0A2H0ULQ1_9BACT|nr:MAG: hypothetical protein COU11_04735 [Candidatus Harrisonbacteria bacterium CG10_big_fil_rev_8_21_14_0_10_49_15]
MIHPQHGTVLYLVNGVFFHSAEEIGLTADYIPDHPALVDPKTLYPFMYSGFIGRDETCVLDGVLTGALLDEFGISELVDVTLNVESGTLEFTKVYVGRPEPIYYRVQRGGFGMWVGSYTIEGTRSGFTRCMLSPVSPVFFQPPPS